MKGRELIQYILTNALENFDFPEFENGEINVNHTTNEVCSENYSGSRSKEGLASDIEQAISDLEDVARALRR